MQLSDIFVALGQQNFAEMLRSVSISKLKTYQMYERVKLRFHLTKLNSESLRKAAPRLFNRIATPEEDFATDVAQTVLVSHLDMIKAVLDFLKIPHEDGFFAKDLDASEQLQGDWKERAWQEFRGKYSDAVLLFYINHLSWEMAKAEEVYQPENAATTA
jgi:inorganic triphosphatase YgiF